MGVSEILIPGNVPCLGMFLGCPVLREFILSHFKHLSGTIMQNHPLVVPSATIRYFICNRTGKNINVKMPEIKIPLKISCAMLFNPKTL